MIQTQESYRFQITPLTAAIALLLLSITSVPAEPLSPTLASAILAVEQGRYLEALSQLDSLPAAALSPLERKRARYVSGQVYLKLKRYPEALQAFGEALDQYPELGDYAIWYVARLYKEVNAVRSQLEALRLLLARFPQSRLVPEARVTLARELIEDTRELHEGVRILQEFLAQHAHDPRLPAVYLLLGQGYEGLGLQEKAIDAFRTLYVQFPASPEANRAAARIDAWLPPERRFPGGLTLSERLERADRLAEAAECARAMPEVQRLSPDSLPHDLQARAIARLGLCAFKLRRYSEAAATLERFRQALVADERAAEALYVLGAARQRERRMAEAEQVFLQLAAREPATSWNAKALVALGSLYEGRQDTTQAIAAYTQLTTRFPGDDRADEMAWRIGWLRYGRQLFGAAVGDFATAADRFPRSMFVSNALYWQAKALERSGESAQATALYERVAQAYPYTYYGIRAMEVALARAPLRNAPGDDSIAANTRVHLAPARERTVELTLAPAATFHRIRVEELLALRFMGEAREELLHLAKRLGEGFPEQMFLARLYLALGLTSQAIRALNAVLASLTPSERLDLPDAFWKLLFPQFYWEAIQDGARLTQLDPLLVMGVIRQESAFNPRAISRSDARGLMQLLPSTGQEIFQRLGLGAFRGDVLFDPRINVRLGTHYLARLATAHQGNLIPTLAAYNAGPTRVKRWLQEVRFADWDEFIENLPFEETRGYVKNVLRNYGVYRRLYALGNETTDEHR